MKNDELLGDQLNNSDISKIIHYLKNCSTLTKDYLPQQYRRYIDKLELKYHLLIYKQNRKSFCVVVPDKTEEIMRLCHCDWASGHFGLFKTHKRILQRFWWPNYLQDLREFVGNCEICLQIKSPNRKFGALGVREIRSKPFDIVSIDFLTDLPITPQGNVHILVVIDWFSKYLQLYPVPNRTAETAARCIRDYSLRFGIPLRMLSDQDPSFESKLFSELMRLLGLKKQRTSGYNPRSYGLVEQANRSVKNYLTSILTENNLVKNYWDRWLLEMYYNYNTSVHSATGFTPAKPMFGRDFRIPIDILYGTVDEKYHHVSIDSFAKQLSKMYAIARENMHMQQIIYKTYYDKKVLDSILEPNDFVFVDMPRLKRVKLATKWHGPHRIVECLHPVYIVEMLTNKGVLGKALPRDKLKKTTRVIELVELNIDGDNHQVENVIDYLPVDMSDSDDSDEEVIQERHNPRYNLRPHVRPPDRYFASIVKNTAAYFL